MAKKKSKKKTKPANLAAGKKLTKASIYGNILNERMQGFATRQKLIESLEKQLRRTVVTYFTSFNKPVSISDDDADIIEDILRSSDTSSGITLLISSPGGDGLAAERIVNLLRSYSGTGEYRAMVPGKAKSAATMICFGSSQIFMGPSSELGPVDPQLRTVEDGLLKYFNLHNLVDSYDELFTKAVNAKTGNLEPYLQPVSYTHLTLPTNREV